MKMCLKLVYCAFSSSPSKDSVSIFWGLSSLFVAALSIVSICGCINKDVSQAILALFSVPSLKDGRVGRCRGFSSLFVDV